MFFLLPGTQRVGLLEVKRTFNGKNPLVSETRFWNLDPETTFFFFLVHFARFCQAS